jgi:hypothetical protein
MSRSLLLVAKREQLPWTHGAKTVAHDMSYRSAQVHSNS